MSIKLYGNDMFGDEIKPNYKGLISERFIVPPFTILNAREGFWQERKRAWLDMGIQSEVTRKESITGINSTSGKNTCMLDGEGARVSIFDPVLTELMYKWFCPPQGQIIDPFAGGSVRGIVAHMLGYKYWGCELRSEQIDANYEQAKEICPDNKPQWIIGDSMNELDNAPDADFIFSCPPYGDLEVYSDDPADLSNMEYHTFIAAYKRIILRACKKLKNNRFACFVVGDFRDKNGNYRDFISHTKNAFIEQGLHLYNEAILINAIGSLPIRITKQFQASRKMGKTHQNVLIFVKGDGKTAAQNINRGDE